MKTTTTCTECGAEIPESLCDDALCTRCRYKPGAQKAGADGPSEYDIAILQWGSEPSEPSEDPAPGDGPRLEAYVAWFILHQAGAQLVGERVLILAFMCQGVYGRPVNLRELGARLGCSHTTAAAKVASLRAFFVSQRGKMEAGGCQPDPM